jgi:hypothetical protein
MDTLTRTTHRTAEPLLAVLRGGIVLLALVTAAVHASLGGVLFTLNAIGYATFAVALVLPGRIAEIRWLVRLGLLGFTAVTICGWIAFGARFPLAYVDKGVEVVLVVFLVLELWLEDGGPVAILHRARALARATRRALAARVGR